MFNSLAPDKISVNEVGINYRTAGHGPPLLLLHGYPQTHYIWHKMAPNLAKHFTVIMSDLRGYGDSDKPPTIPDHEPYSKRAMASDQVHLMRKLGFEQFYVVGHDRGGRVAHRMALDHPGQVLRLGVLDIAPTYTMYNTTDKEFATAYFHWFFLIQPNPYPERIINQDPLKVFGPRYFEGGKSKPAFSKKALDEYIRCWTPEMIHASCEDYRASATIDLEHDKADLAAGNKIQCPLLALWGTQGFVGHKYDVIAEWKKWADKVEGHGLECGHFIPEEAPVETAKHLMRFLRQEVSTK